MNECARKTFQGAWEIYSTDSNDHLVTRMYFGYTKREALRMFRQEMRTLERTGATR